MSYRTGHKINLSQFEKSPIALKVFLHWLKNNDNISEYDTENITTEMALGCVVYENTTKWNNIKGFMYGFLDENYIFVRVELELQYTRGIDEDGNNPHYVPDGFRYIIDDTSYCVGFGGVFDTRSQAEEEAFVKAFGVLEDRIK